MEVSERRYIVWKRRDGVPKFRCTMWHDDDGHLCVAGTEIISTGLFGRIQANHPLLESAKYPDDKRPMDLDVNERICKVRFNVDGKRPYYDVWRVK